MSSSALGVLGIQQAQVQRRELHEPSCRTPRRTSDGELQVRSDLSEAVREPRPSRKHGPGRGTHRAGRGRLRALRGPAARAGPRHRQAGPRQAREARTQIRDLSRPAPEPPDRAVPATGRPPPARCPESGPGPGGTVPGLTLASGAARQGRAHRRGSDLGGQRSLSRRAGASRPGRRRGSGRAAALASTRWRLSADRVAPEHRYLDRAHQRRVGSRRRYCPPGAKAGRRCPGWPRPAPSTRCTRCRVRRTRSATGRSGRRRGHR